MAKISLRAYTQEIERLIENKRLDEALAHCHHILEAYPKHLDTYRLFGKAYLEQQRFGDAADIFQRVLSALPDDFISHVGMSIIREDEGNLDEALYHIQQASETQPSNAAIQDELRRLYRRRDGIAPPKIRLTRGALARMYVKGELYQQASVEIRAALAEDANRIDLQLLLAQIYIHTGKTSEAIELARNILRKLPNAYQANQILAALLPLNDHETEARQYSQVVNKLNPYAAFISEQHPNPEEVPDQSVILEKLEWKPGQGHDSLSRQPAWAESLGLKLGDTQKQAVEEIPDWMKSAGWKTGGEDAELPGSEQDETKDQTSLKQDTATEIEKADLPDWLKEMAPAEGMMLAKSDIATEDEEAQTEDVLPWLEKIFPSKPTSDQEITPELDEFSSSWQASESSVETPQEEDQLPPWLAEVDSEAKLEEEGDTIPDWLTASNESKIGEEGAHELESAAELAAEIPDGLTTPDESQAVLEETPEVEDAAELTAEIPDWLTAPDVSKAAKDETPEAEGAAELAADIPDWLTAPDVSKAAKDETPEAEGAAELAADIPDWLTAPDVSKAAKDETPEAEGAAELAADIPDWLTAPDVSKAAKDETPEAEGAAELAAEIPDWLKAPDESKAAWEETSEVEDAAELAAEIPDWLKAPDESTSAWDETPEAENATELAAEIPDWLKAPDVSKAALDETPEAEDAAELAAEIPDWLSRLEEPEPSLDDTQPSKTTLAQAQAEISEKELDQAAEKLEAIQPIEALSEAETQTSSEKTVVETVEPSAKDGTGQQDEAFAWLESLAAKQGADQETLFSGDSRTETTPDWIVESVSEAAETDEAQSERGEQTTPEAEPSPQDLEWLVERDEETAAPLEVEPASEEPSEVVKVSKVEEAISKLEELDDGFAWLESLAAKQGAEEALLLKPEERHTEAPEWVRLESLKQPVDTEPETPPEVAFEGEALLDQAPELNEQDLETPISAQQESQESIMDLPEEEPETEEITTITAEMAQPTEAEQATTAWQETAVVESESVVESRAEISAESQADSQDEGGSPEPEYHEGAAPQLEQVTAESLDAEEMPELPAWLADAEASPEDEALEWTPPARTIKPVELNQASLVELERLPGIGFRLAQEIILYRDQQGLFSNLDQLRQVPGAEDLSLEDLAAFLILPERVEPLPEAEPSSPGLAFEETAASPELEAARQALLQADLPASLQIYTQLIESQQALPEIIEDLEKALKYQSDSFELWQTLGDAYQRSNQTREALSAYLKAEEQLG